MTNHIPFIKWSLVAIGLFVSANAMSQESCFRADDCDDDAICINLECVTPESPLSSCASDDECDWHETCQQGNCKLAGVICENEGGICSYESDSSWCECASGEEMGSGSVGDVPIIPDRQLYEMCMEDLLMACDEEPMDPDDYCTEDEKALCTDLIVKYETLDENCDEEGDETWPTIGDTAYEGDIDTAVSVDLDTEGVSDGDGDIADEPPADTDGATESGEGSGGAPDVAAMYEPDPWEIVDCCDDIRYAEEEAALHALFDCIIALEPDDCEGFQACEATFDDSDEVGGDDEVREDGDTENVDVTQDTAAGDADGDVDEEANGDADTEKPAETPDETADDDGDKDDGSKANTASTEESSGCSTVSVARSSALIAALNALL